MKRAIGKMLWKMGDALALGYDAGESSRVRRDLGWGRSTPRDEDRLVGDSLETIRLKAFDLRRNNAIVAGVSERLASFAVGHSGITPQCQTSDPGWNRASEQWWADWSARCDSRRRLSLYDLQWMAVASRPTHGGMYLELLEDGTIRPIECERIRNPRKPPKETSYSQGVSVDPQTGIVRAYLVHSRDKSGGFGGEHVERPVPAESMLPVVCRPWRLDQVREIPELAPVVPHLTDIHEMNTFALNTAKAQSGILGFLRKQSGMGLNAMPRGSSTATVGQRQTFKFEWGQVLEGFPGDDLEMKYSPTPGTTHIPYIQLQLGLCACALDVPYEFLTLDFSKANLSRMSGILLLVNKAMRNRQRWVTDSMLRPLWLWRIAMEMRPGGDLAPAPTRDGVSEWGRVDWQPPEEPWVDRQEAQQSDVLEIQAALTTFSRASRRRGFDFEDTLRERAREEQLIDQVSAETGVDRARLVKMQIPGQTDPDQRRTPQEPNKESTDEPDRDDE
jgi:lambda family phage portal protein